MAAALENGLCTKPKDNKQSGLKSVTAPDDALEEGNETDSRSDSDRVESLNTNSIRANQKRRRQEAAAAFKKKLEEKRMAKVANVTPSAMTKSSQPIVENEARTQATSGNSTVSKDVANLSADDGALARISSADSGYMTRKEIVPAINARVDALAGAVKRGETIPPRKSAKAVGKSGIPLPVAFNPPPLPPVISPVSDTDHFIMINGHPYRILNQIGRGGSSQVYQVYDEEGKRCLAVKRVDLSDADEVVVTAYRKEIELLERLQKYPDRVVRMFDYEYVESDQCMYVVMEKGDTDLATLFKSRQGSNKLTEQMIAFYWLEMLKAVQVIHIEGIVHSDLKPANFLLVAGNLKLIDFGIANAVPANKTSVTRDCQMGTLNYMSPEAISCAGSGPVDDAKLRVGVKSDVWSLGCMLYTMVYGKTPFQDIRNPVAKMTAMLNRKHAIQFPPVADANVISAIKRCLERDPKKRASVDELLNHPYCKTPVLRGTAGCDESASTSSGDDSLRELAETISKTTPRTGARLIKAAMAQMTGLSGEQQKAALKALKF